MGGALTTVGALTAMLVFAAATQGYFVCKSRVWESVALLLAVFTLLRPGYWMDMVIPPWEMTEPKRIVRIAESRPADADLRLHVEGENFDGDFVRLVAVLPLGPIGDGLERLRHGGIAVRLEPEGKVYIDTVTFGSTAERSGIDFDWRITGIALAVEQPGKQLMFIPALLLIGLVAGLQFVRRPRKEG